MDALILRRATVNKANLIRVPFTTTCRMEYLGNRKFKLSQNGEIVFHTPTIVNVSLMAAGYGETKYIDEYYVVENNVLISANVVYQLKIGNGKWQTFLGNGIAMCRTYEGSRYATSGFGFSTEPYISSSLRATSDLSSTDYDSHGYIILEIL